VSGRVKARSLFITARRAGQGPKHHFAVRVAKKGADPSSPIGPLCQARSQRSDSAVNGPRTWTEDADLWSKGPQPPHLHGREVRRCAIMTQLRPAVDARGCGARLPASPSSSPTTGIGKTVARGRWGDNDPIERVKLDRHDRRPTLDGGGKKRSSGVSTSGGGRRWRPIILTQARFGWPKAYPATPVTIVPDKHCVWMCLDAGRFAGRIRLRRNSASQLGAPNRTSNKPAVS